MAIPDFQACMLPIMQALSDGSEKHVQKIREHVAQLFNTTVDEQEILIPSGGAKLFSNRVAWGIAYLKMAELVESKKRSHYSLTPAGLSTMKSPPQFINIRWLHDNTNFKDKKASWPSAQGTDESPSDRTPSQTPDEMIEYGFAQINQQLKRQLLEMIKAGSPAFFEKLVLDLLLAMGYGTEDEDSGIVTGKTGDEGIDGLIKEDKLGLERIYVQAKKWEGSVGSQELQKFAGALQGRRARKGVFITTSSFSQPAQDFVNKIDTRIVLIDGEMLTELMIANDVGVSLKKAYEIKKLDSDYFIEE